MSINLNDATYKQVEAVLVAIYRNKPKPPAFIPARFPYTYAYDYMRNHWSDFKLYGKFHIDADLSRSECAARLRGNPDKEIIVEACAMEYLAEHNISMQCVECGEDYRDTDNGCDTCAPLKVSHWRAP